MKKDRNAILSDNGELGGRRGLMLVLKMAGLNCRCLRPRGNAAQEKLRAKITILSRRQIFKL